jgi:site-specific recombinase XerD
MIYLERDEVRRLLTVARKYSELHYAALLVSFLHGLRVSEALKIKGADICDGKLSVKRKKRSKTTLHELRLGGDPLFDESSVLALARENRGRLFDWSRQYFDVLIKKYAAEADIHPDKAHHHVLKHSIAMILWFETHNLNAIQDWLGHRTPSSSLIYMRADGAQEAQRTVQGMTI